MARSKPIVFAGGLTGALALVTHHAMSGNGGATKDPDRPVTATPSGEAQEWTPERLRNAKPVEMPVVPTPEPPEREPRPPREPVSERGAGSPGSDDVGALDLETVEQPQQVGDERMRRVGGVFRRHRGRRRAALVVDDHAMTAGEEANLRPPGARFERPGAATRPLCAGG